MPTIQLDGVSLYYEEQGTGSAVLLLHGLGSSGRDWESLPARLAARYRVVVPDARGHGRSDKPKGAYGVPLFARDTAALCDRLGIKQAHVVGVSMGGMMALQLAIDRPDLVASLVLINSGPDMIPRTLRFWLALKLRVLLLDLLGPKRLAVVIARRLFPKPEQEALRTRFMHSIAANDPDAYSRATRGLLGWSVLDRLAEIRCPVLVLASERDYTPTEMKRAYTVKLKDARLVELKDSGHAAPNDQPELVADAIERFLRDEVPAAAR